MIFPDDIDSFFGGRIVTSKSRVVSPRPSTSSRRTTGIPDETPSRDGTALHAVTALVPLDEGVLFDQPVLVVTLRTV